MSTTRAHDIVIGIAVAWARHRGRDVNVHKEGYGPNVCVFGSYRGSHRTQFFAYDVNRGESR